MPVDLGAVKLPIFVLATREDHIVPWRSAYRTLGLLGGEDKTFVLGASGHIAGVVNPAAKKRRSYWAEPLTPRTRTSGCQCPGNEMEAGGRCGANGSRHGGGTRKAPS